ncbi:MAG: adenylyltransferase/cytidyltransferase family protein [Chlamydiia bacterium]|nr:adenylyltransferase/cytidyltransferase family protein [Chlamydiia bacterium]
MQSAWPKNKLLEPNSVEEKVRLLRARSLKIATLNGSFDVLHAGHLYILHEARKQGDVLIVALNSDDSIRKYKSPDRPIIALPYRLEMMAALECVDFVTWFEEADPCTILQKIRPDVHVNGAEYGDNCVEAECVKACGGRLHLVQRIPSLSTSNIVSKIKSLKG